MALSETCWFPVESLRKKTKTIAIAIAIARRRRRTKKMIKEEEHKK